MAAIIGGVACSLSGCHMVCFVCVCVCSYLPTCMSVREERERERERPLQAIVRQKAYDACVNSLGKHLG